MLEYIKRALNIVFLWKKAECEGKNPLLSKTIWVNVVALAAVLLSSYTGIILTPEMQVGILALVNIVLRLISKQPVGLWEEKTGSESLQDKNEPDGSEKEDTVGQGRDGFPTHTGDG